MKRKDFLPFGEQQSQALVDHAQALAQKAGAPYQHLQGKHNKEELVRKLLRQQPPDEGLVAVLCCLETCRTVQLLGGQQRPHLAFRRRPQRILYFYFLDADFGLLPVRVQTWFPFTCQVYGNGHEGLARQLQQRRLGFVQNDNAFSQLDDPAAAQALADGFAQLDWVALLDRWVQPLNPLLEQPWLERRSYRWVIDQAEFSTDLIFIAPQEVKATRTRSVSEAASLWGPR